MDTKRFALLLDVVKIGSIKRAAEELNYTQSGLIYQINTLEQEIGAPLLVRNHKGVSLTSVGLALEPHFREFVKSAAVLDSEIKNTVQKGSQTLRIGVVTSALCGWFPELLRDFCSQNPEIKTSIFNGTTEVPRWLESDLVDLAIVPKGLSSGHKWRFLHKDTICVCVSSNHALASQSTVCYDDLKGLTLLNPGYAETSAYDELYERIGYSSKDEISGLQISNTDGSTLLPLVASGLGATFLADSYLSICPSTVTMIPLNPALHREIGIITAVGKPLSTATRKYIHYLEDQLND